MKYYQSVKIFVSFGWHYKTWNPFFFPSLKTVFASQPLFGSGEEEVISGKWKVQFHQGETTTTPGIGSVDWCTCRSPIWHFGQYQRHCWYCYQNQDISKSRYSSSGSLSSLDLWYHSILFNTDKEECVNPMVGRQIFISSSTITCYSY